MVAPNKGKGAAAAWLFAQADYEGNECILWPFSRPTGYGQFGFEGKIYRAHRYMCELVKGPPPTPEHQASHSCGNGRKGCITPRHLSWKTNGENQLDRTQHGTRNVWGGRGKSGKFNAEQTAEIRRLYEGGKTQTQLAKMFGVTHSTIQYQLWKRKLAA